ncbi:MAG: hypothetical protein B7Z55_00595 [Planctomycetales bacterium 12-60-4]|nr:MAG: hypothetical protein B7Z55_00595 [Planctomycetales bacterium 12-60-4]
MSFRLQVLYEDNHCLAVAKPAGLLTMGDATGDTTLLEHAKAYIQQKYQKPGAVFLGVVHRLDRPVSGVVLFARTSKAASRLSEQFREHRIEKVYWAVVAGTVTPVQGELVQELEKNPSTNVVHVVDRATARSQPCRLNYRKLAQYRAVSLIEVRPETGRSHQIRVQLAHQGWPIVGDRKYGGPPDFTAGQIALHARALTFDHPTQHTPTTVQCAPPATWKQWSFPVDGASSSFENSNS